MASEARPGLLSGRSPRSHMWATFLAVITGAVIVATVGTFMPGDAGGVLAIVFIVAANIGQIIVGVRRLNDIGQSGWWILAAFVPLANLVLLVILLFRPSVNPEGEQAAI